MTRQENFFKKKREKWIGIRNGFLAFPWDFIVHTLVIKHDQLGIFEHDKSYFSYHVCIHHIRYQVKYLILNLFPKVKKYGRPMGSSNQCHGEHPKRIRTWHPRDKGTTGQIDKLVWEPHQNRGDASSRPITFAKSIGPSTIHPDYELSATRNWSSQPAATKAYSSACF